MEVTDNHTITIEIDGTEHVVSIADAQRLYDLLGDLAGIRRHIASLGPDWFPNRIATGGFINVDHPRPLNVMGG